jgi:hypothetical protein
MGEENKGGRVQEKGRSAIEEEEEDCIGIDSFRCRPFQSNSSTSKVYDQLTHRSPQQDVFKVSRAQVPSASNNPAVLQSSCLVRLLSSGMLHHVGWLISTKVTEKSAALKMKVVDVSET